MPALKVESDETSTRLHAVIFMAGVSHRSIGIDMNLTLLTGADVLDCMSSDEFRASWMALYDCCPWTTACQHPDFVKPWYQIYHSVFLPVVIFSKCEDGSLAGLLTLALRHDTTVLTGAGAEQAEYQCWIALKETGDEFIVCALTAIRARFPRIDIHLKYLPPGIPLQAICENKSLYTLSTFRTHRRPVMKIDTEAMGRQRNKKNHRQNYNRLKRAGEVRLERVMEDERFDLIFNEICIQYDFRQAALYQNMPFANDPFKKLFYIELHKRRLLHATILMVGSQLAASHIGLVSGNQALHLGISTYDPSLAAHSPGNLLLAMLGVHLATERIAVLDLTPGGDGYKEHFASDHDAVFELTIYSSLGTRMKSEAVHSVIGFSKTKLRGAGYRTSDVRATFKKLQSISSPGIREILQRLRLRWVSRHCTFRYHPRPQAATQKKLTISKNRLHDVLKFDAQGSTVRYCEFLGAVMKQMERNSQLYSFVANDKLLVFCWVRMGSTEPSAPGESTIPSSPAASIVLFDLYVHRQLSSSELVGSFVQQILRDLTETAPGTGIFYHGALTGNLETVMKGCGFIDEVK